MANPAGESNAEVLRLDFDGNNGRHALVGMLRQSVFGRLAGYEDVNDAERRHDPAMRWIVGDKAALGAAASPSQMGRFETRWLTAAKNLSALADLSGRWIDTVHGCRPPRGIVLAARSRSFISEPTPALPIPRSTSFSKPNGSNMPYVRRQTASCRNGSDKTASRPPVR
jgi:hypothetical protein